MTMSEVIRRKLPLIAAVSVYLVVSSLTIGCPIKFLTGIPCPGCGMSRALTAALRLDFAAALSAHPLFPAAPLFALYLIFGDLLPKKTDSALLYIFCALFIGVYIYRMFFTSNPVTAIDLDGGFVVKLFKSIISFHGGS